MLSPAAAWGVQGPKHQIVDFDARKNFRASQYLVGVGLIRNRKVLRERRHTWERGCGLLEELPFIKTLFNRS